MKTKLFNVGDDYCYYDDYDGDDYDDGDFFFLLFFLLKHKTQNTKPVQQVGIERKKRNVLREKLPLTDVLLPLMNKVAFQCPNNARNTK